MNERIMELAEQAETKEVGYYFFDREKFAELLIRECARIARATPCPDFDEHVKEQLGHTWDMAAIESGREIVKHFGIEK